MEDKNNFCIKCVTNKIKSNFIDVFYKYTSITSIIVERYIGKESSLKMSAKFKNIKK